MNIDSANHDYIIEDLDEERVVVKETMVAALKQKLEDVSLSTASSRQATDAEKAQPADKKCVQRLKENLPPVDESGSE